MTRLSLAVAAALAQDDPCGFDSHLTLDDIDLTPDDIEQAARLWAWLCDDQSERVRREVVSDAGLIVALNLPAVEFMHWFRVADWQSFDATGRTGGDAWAWAVMRRAWGACEALGAMATQVPMRAHGISG